MMIHDITAKAGKYKRIKRLGRGPGSGRGKRSTRGQKGAGSRSGTAARHQFEGGQMPYFRRLPKFGFTNAKYKTLYWIVNIGDVVAHPDFAKGGTVNAEALIKAGLVRDTSRDLKILGGVGEEGLKARLTVEAARVSIAARRLIEGSGGSVRETGTRRDKVRGVDRNSDDLTPKNLTKKLKRRAKTTTPPAAEEAPEKGASKPEGKSKGEGKPEGKPRSKPAGEAPKGPAQD